MNEKQIREQTIKECIATVEGMNGNFHSKIGYISNIEWLRKNDILTKLRNMIEDKK